MFAVTYEDLWTLCTFWDPEVCEPFEAFLGTRGTPSQGGFFFFFVFFFFFFFLMVNNKWGDHL